MILRTPQSKCAEVQQKSLTAWSHPAQESHRLELLGADTYTRGMVSLPRASSWALAVLVTLLFGAEAFADAGAAKPVCPPAATPAPERTRAVVSRLRSQPQGEALWGARHRPLVVCYGNVPEGTLQTNGVVVLQEKQAIAANAARLGHLLHHLVHGLPFDDKTVSTSALACDELVRKAHRSERAAHDLENRLRRAFHLSPLAFEDLSESYRQRCDELRKQHGNPATM